jgi:hypothetical protein
VDDGGSSVGIAAVVGGPAGIAVGRDSADEGSLGIAGVGWSLGIAAEIDSVGKDLLDIAVVDGEVLVVVVG